MVERSKTRNKKAMRVFILYNPKQKIDYRKIKRWKVRVNVSNNFYKNLEED
jgi:hypothetical protein